MRACKYCKRDMTETTCEKGYRENPFCSECFNERLAKAMAETEPKQAICVGKYTRFVPQAKEPTQ